jgi:hypothetical protein
MWCGDCYTSNKDVFFVHVWQDPILADGGTMEQDLVDKDHPGNFRRASPLDPKTFHYAWNGEHCMISFECNYWVFSRIWPGDRPDPTHETDKFLMACIHCFNLDSFWSGATGKVSLNCQVINKGRLVVSKKFGSVVPYDECVWVCLFGSCISDQSRITASDPCSAPWSWWFTSRRDRAITKGWRLASPIFC